jgi:hypothetical protein
MHRCPAPHCPRRVPAHILACRDHWFALSTATRNAVYRAYRIHGPGSDQHVAAVRAAVEEWNS